MVKLSKPDEMLYLNVLIGSPHQWYRFETRRKFYIGCSGLILYTGGDTLKGRQRWDSRLLFVFAAIGSAIGLGNIWRFPYLAYEHGGGAFLIPYAIALLVIGIPILVLEFGMGQKAQKGAIGAFKSINKKFGFTGFLAIAAAAVITSYYAVVLVWSLVYFIGSLRAELPWAGGSEDFFLNNVLQLTEGVGVLGNISIPLVIGLAVVWGLIYLSVFQGVKSVGRVVLVTMPLPIILLGILLVRALTLEGALQGVAYYIRPDFNALLSAEIWLAAIGQIFFTLSVGFGIMIAYASYNNKKQSITRGAIFIALINSGFSLLAGFVVFGVLGHMALAQDVAIDEVVQSGVTLAFVVFPEALNLLPFAPVFSALFFLMLLALGIDSAFSLVEAISTVISDTRKKLAKHWVALSVCVVGFFAGLLYTTGAGLYFLDIVDHFVTNYALVIVGTLECLIVGWALGAQKLRKYINSVSYFKLGAWWDVTIRWIIPAALVVLLAVQFWTDVNTPYGGYPLWALSIGWAVVVVPLAVAGLMLVTAKK